jgi:hypothetical protein
LISLTVIATVGLRAQRQFSFFASFVDTSSDQPIDTVSQDQVEVRENNVAGRVVRMEAIKWPVRVELLLDNGIGVGSENLSHLRNGVLAFMEALPSGVETTLITTAPQPRTVVGPTTDRKRLLSGAGLLTPENSAGRFIDALSEAAARLEKTRGDKERSTFFPVVVALASTGLEGSTFVERDVERLLTRFQQSSATVHVIMLSSAGHTSDGGAVQMQVGMAVTKATGGRYDGIAAAGRIRTLLPEIAEQIARSHARQSKQFRITFERPDGNSGPLGQVTLAGPSSLTVQLSVDGRLP